MSTAYTQNMDVIERLLFSALSFGHISSISDSSKKNAYILILYPSCECQAEGCFSLLKYRHRQGCTLEGLAAGEHQR